MALTVAALIASTAGCAAVGVLADDTSHAASANPAAPGFNAEASDPEAIAVADRTMRAMGGREAWDETRYLTWNFFGRRRHVWDKSTGNLRIEYKDAKGLATTWLMNINTKEGRVLSDEDGDVTSPQVIQQGYEAWVNDSYWLIMPYKLKDTGVTLAHLGEDETNAGEPAEVVQLTFEDVGVTPRNKYHVWIGKDSDLVEQWAFFMTADDDEPRLATPWTDWERHGRIMLSDGRGEREITDIAVFDDLPESVFTSFDPVDFDALLTGQSN